ncbi:MAG: hypothetical protein ACRD2Q_10690 [Terriglobales bacterium]
MRWFRHSAYGFLATVFLGLSAQAASKAPAIVFGKWLAVEWHNGAAEEKPLPLKVRALFVSGRMREYTLGEPHVVTDSLFVIQRAYRLNDLLPGEKGSAPRWRWQPGGWLLVNRVTGRVSQLTLPHFDAHHSVATWYRDYVAYCGLSEDGYKIFAVVAQLGRRKPLLQHELGRADQADLADVECATPRWQRRPTRVTFEPAGRTSLTFEVRGHAAEPAAAEPEDSTE